MPNTLVFQSQNCNHAFGVSLRGVASAVYQAFPIRDALRLELSWSHDTKLIKSIAVLAFLPNWNAVRT